MFSTIDWLGVGRIVLDFGVAIVSLVLLFYLISKFFSWLQRRLEAFGQKLSSTDHLLVRFFEKYTSLLNVRFLSLLLKFAKVAAILIVLLIVTPYLFTLVPATKFAGNQILEYIFLPLKAILNGFFDYIPKLFSIVVTLFVAYYVIKLLRFFAIEIKEEKIKLSAFYPDWAMPTFNLLRIAVIVFAIIDIFPNLPGADSEEFRYIMAFLGVVASLGSTHLTSNLMAGIVLIYMRPFQVNDRVEIGGKIGDIVERTLLVTRIKTVKNEAITIPNARVLDNNILNFTARAKDLGLILHTSVTIGYDVSWQNVHELLIRAALKTNMVDEEPSPFVMQKSLDDFYVAYEINCYTRSPDHSFLIYSELHKNILDEFNQAGVEILSPHYRAGRDGSDTTIPG